MGPRFVFSPGLVRICLRPAMLLWSVVLVSACGSGSSSGSSTDLPPTPVPVASAAPELSNVSPTALSFDLQTNESATGEVTFDNTGDAALIYELTTAADWVSLPVGASGTLAAGASASLSLNVTCGESDLADFLVLVTNDADEGQVDLPIAASCTPPAGGFQIARVLLNQGVRAFDSNLADTPGIEIAAGREMAVRAFVTGRGVPPDARVVVERPGLPVFTVAMQTPPSVDAVPASEAMLNASHYVVLPASAMLQGTTLRIEVAPFNNPVAYPANGVIELDVQDPGAFEITFVPVTFQGQTPSISISTYMREVLKVLPLGEVSVDVRTPYTFTGAFDLEEVLMEIADLRNLDGSNRLYHAVIIPPEGSSAPTAGVGFVGFPVSVSIDLGGASFVVAHELGHNLNLGHAPGCDAPNADADFPHANGAVNSWGFDTVNDVLVSPAAKSDFMSYCSDLWVSDYHFNRAMEFRSQVPSGTAPPAARGLFISGRITGDAVSAVRMMPVPGVSMPFSIDEADHEFRFIAWDVNGAEVVNEFFSPRSIEDLSPGTEAFMLSVPAPRSPIDHFEIRRLGVAVHSQRLTRRDQAVAVDLTAANSGVRLGWSPRSGDALILRDGVGRVVAVDRTGSVALPNSADLSAEIISRGLAGPAVSVFTGGNRQLLLTR